MTVWVVRAGRHGEREDFSIEEGVCAIGWDRLVDFSNLDSREEIQELLEQEYPDAGTRTISNWAGQIWGFVNGMEVNDIVTLPLKSSPAVAIGVLS